MLKRKMLRDLRLYRVQFVSIFLLSFLALFIFSGLGSESAGYEKTLTEYYKETDMADIWLYGNSFSSFDVRKAEGVKGVAMAERRLALEAAAGLDNGATLDVYFVDEAGICSMHLIDGETYRTGAEGIWLDKSFADANELSVNDSLTITAMGMTLTERIAGLVISPEYVYKESEALIPDHSRSGFAFLSTDSLPEQIPVSYNQMVLTLEDGAAIGIDLENALYDAVGGISIMVAREDTASDSVFRSEISERRSMTAVFPAAFIAIVLLTILTTMTRLVANQRLQIGTLKALGFGRGRITRHYTRYSLFLTAVGALLGAVTGPMVLPPMMYSVMRTTFTLPEWRPAFLPSTPIVAVLIVIASVLVTRVCCRNLLRQSPADTLRAPAPKTKKASALERSRFWQRRSFAFQWNVRDVFRSGKRSLVTVLGITGCMGLLICGMGCLDFFRGVLDTKYDEICRYSCRYKLDETITDRQLETVIDKTDGAAAMLTIMEIKSESGKQSTGLRVQDGTELYRFLDSTFEEQPLPTDGMSITLKTAEELGVTVGDTVEWHTLGSSVWNTSKITAVYRDPTEQGGAMSVGEFESFGLAFKPSEVYSAGERPDSLPGVSGVESLAESRKAVTDMLETMYLLIGVLCAAAAILAIVVLYNLGVLSFTEKERELATMKVLGFQSGTIRRLLLTQNVWLSLIALIPGYYFGVLLLKVIMANMGSEFDMVLRISPVSVVICSAFTMLLSVAVNYLFSGRVRKLNMVEALKSME